MRDERACERQRQSVQWYKLDPSGKLFCTFWAYTLVTALVINAKLQTSQRGRVRGGKGKGRRGLGFLGFAILMANAVMACHDVRAGGLGWGTTNHGRYETFTIHKPCIKFYR